MTRNHLRRRFSLALPAFVFFSFTLAETVEVRAMTEAVLALSSVDEQPAQIKHRIEDAFQVKTCKPVRKGANEA